MTPEAAAALRAPDHGWRAGVRELARLWLQDGRRWLLWSLLVVLVAVLLVTLVVLARRFEMEQVQRALERDNADAVVDLRHALSADAQRLRQLTAAAPSTDLWEMKAQDLLVAHPAWLRLEWRDAALHLKGERTSPFTSQPLAPPVDQTPLLAACADARRLGAAGFAPSRFVPREGLGVEVMPMCVLVVPGNGAPTYAIAYYALDGVLNHLLGEPYKRRQTVSLTEPDGTRLAVHGSPRRGARIFTSQQMLDLPGNTMVLRMDGWRAAPDLFPNVLTALVTVLAVALITVLVMLARDFRRRQQAEGELADALAFRKAMEDSLVTGLRARDLQGRISYVNPAFCAMVGYDAPELIGHDGPPPYWPPELADSYGRRTAARLAAGGPPRQGVESEFQRKDGSRVPVLIIEAPLITATGKHSGWMGAVIDLSEQRRIEEQQRAAQERLQATARLAAVGEMASLLSHELNQPLAAISSYANGSLNLLHGQEEGGVSLQDVRVALGRIADQAGRAGRVINSVHELARRGATARAAVAPQALVEAVLPLVQLQARKLGASVVVQVPAGLPDVGCEPTMVEQVLLNLARNGLQAMAGRRGERLLTIAAERVGGEGPRQWVAFSVADTGEGIAPEVAEQLFTPFFTTKAEGMGLGLSLCRTVVEQHGGALDHAPNTPHGTVFRFTLPVAVPARNIDEIAV